MNGGTIFVIASGAVVALGLGLAFSVIGTPAHARLVAADKQRADDLVTISRVMKMRYPAADGALPIRLPTDITAFPGSRPIRDPITGRAYEYERLGDRAYRLCATFSLPAPSDVDDVDFVAEPAHAAGRGCRRFDLRAADAATRTS